MRKQLEDRLAAAACGTVIVALGAACAADGAPHTPPAGHTPEAGVPDAGERRDPPGDGGSEGGGGSGGCDLEFRTCEPGEREACAAGGERTCAEDCTWGPCSCSEGCDGGPADAPDAGPEPQPVCPVNPGLEGSPGCGVAPSGWELCSGTPDIHPYSWPADPDCYGTAPTLRPVHGTTYIGLLHATSLGWQERIGQRLDVPLASGVTYEATYWLAHAFDVGNGWYGRNGRLRVYGGTGPCERSELLWESEATGSSWAPQEAILTPSGTYEYLVLEVHDAGSNTYLLIDDGSCLSPQLR